MQLDPYAMCPGGTGKKLKFCCSDMLKELDDVTGLMNGNQPLAALERIRQLEEKFPDRACLLNYRILLEQSLGELDQAAATAQRFIEKYPTNSVAMANYAIFNEMHQDNLVEALHLLYRSIEADEKNWQMSQIEGACLIGGRLIEAGFVPAGLAILRIVFSVLEGNEPLKKLFEHCGALIESTERNVQIPLLLKDEFRFANPPEEALWKKSALEVRELLGRGLILKTAEAFAKLAESAGQWPEIMRSLATARLWLAEPQAAAEALRTISRRPNLPASGHEFEQAVDAEALLQLIDENLKDTVSHISVSYPISDYENAYTALVSSPQIERYQGDLSLLQKSDGPPPKLVCRVFDRPYAEKPTGDPLAISSLPEIIGSLFLFGKETDRDARVELLTYNTEVRTRGEHILQSLLGENVRAPEAEQTLESISMLEYLLRPSFWVSQEMSDTDRILYEQNRCRHAFEQMWCNTPLKALNGETPLQAGADPQLQVPLAAAVWLIELDGPAINSEIDVAALRTKLKLPPRPTLTVDDAQLLDLPVSKYLQLDLASLTEGQLINVYAGSSQFRFIPAIKRVAAELLARDNKQHPGLEEYLYLQLAEVEQFDFKAIEYVRLARQAAEAAGRPTVTADLTELPLLFYRGKSEEFFKLFESISKKYQGNEAVTSRLMMILMQLGILRPDGSMAMPNQARAASSGQPAAAASEAGPGGLWTPDSAAATGEKKSSLWVPD